MCILCIRFLIGIAFAALALPVEPVRAVDAGAKLFRKNCKVCHTIGKGEAARQGPNLWGVAGRVAGTVVGFGYSEAIKSAGIVWTAENLDAWLADPKALIPGSTMLYKQKDPDVRRRIVEFVMAAHD